jgi:hypothetical protein
VLDFGACGRALITPPFCKKPRKKSRERGCGVDTPSLAG